MAGQAILWDFDGTLAYREGLWGGCLLEVLRERIPDAVITLDDIRPLLKNRFPWHTPDVPHPELSTPEAWWEVVEGLLYRACLGLGIGDADARLYARETHHRYLDVAGFQLFDDTLPVLEALRESGWRHVILSNHVPELRDLVEGLKLAHLVDEVVTSAITGYEKPHPRAFELGHEAAGGAREIWMVGDNAVADVRGAEAVGIPAILVRHDDERAARHFENLHDLLPFLLNEAVAEVTIRRARAGEAEIIFGIQRASALAAFAHIFDPVEHPFPEDTERGRATEYIDRPEVTVLVAQVDGDVVAVAVTEGAALVRLFVSPERWGTGVGSRLHDAAVSEIRAQGHAESRLWTLEKNRPARDFYERRGWRSDGRTRISPFPPHPVAVGYMLRIREEGVGGTARGV
jgi:putative hydrolase of the HAD superfamily